MSAHVNRKSKTAIILGNGGMAARCVERLVKHENISVPLIVYHDGLTTWTSALQNSANALGVRGLRAENVNAPSVLATIGDLSPDIIFSVNNFDIIKSDLLNIPNDGIINFHNGPLPAYRGVNIPSWAIINQEEFHGVCWHFIDSGIDTGNIVAGQTFAIDADETAISLTFKCIDAGLELFDKLLKQYVQGTLTGVSPQGKSSYYSRKMTPNEGFLDFTWSYGRLSALVRGLNFRPFENDFVYPKVHTGSDSMVISEIRKCTQGDVGPSGEAGEVLEIDDLGITVCGSDAVVRVSGLMDRDLAEISPGTAAERLNIGPGVVLGDQTR